MCGERVFSTSAVLDDDGLRRRRICRSMERPFSLSVSYGSDDGGLRELFHLLKYNGVRPAAKLVRGRMLAESFTALEPAFEQAMMDQLPGEPTPILVLPVPLYKTRRRQRGVNHAELIARAARRFLPANKNLRRVPDLLLRTRDTPSQISLTSHQRGVNLRGAFSVARPSEVTGREVLLVDDGYTTGTTATECARVLLRAGAAQVWVATVARTTKLASNNGAGGPGAGGPQDDDEVDDPADRVNEEHLARAVGS